MYICLKCKFFNFFVDEFSWIFNHCHVPLKVDLHSESLSIVTYLYYDISIMQHPELRPPTVFMLQKPQKYDFFFYC